MKVLVLRNPRTLSDRPVGLWLARPSRKRPVGAEGKGLAAVYTRQMFNIVGASLSE